MKTLAEFIQRLQDDAAFEKQAHAFDHGDDLMAFVKREGYDFTLEQLMNELEPEEKLPAETAAWRRPPADISPSPPPGPDEAEFPRQPEALSSEESGTALPERGIDDFTREPALGKIAATTRGQCRRRNPKKCHWQSCLEVAAGGTGGSPPRD